MYGLYAAIFFDELNANILAIILTFSCCRHREFIFNSACYQIKKQETAVFK